MTFEQLVQLAKTWNREGKLRKDAPKEITVYEVQDQRPPPSLSPNGEPIISIWRNLTANG
jgi:hypothetical protein